MQSRVSRIVAILFFLSGAAGLVYEIAWARVLALFMGNTAHAQAVVIGVFMAGLAAGSVWLGRISDRSRSPLRLYAWLELGIGLYGLAFPALMQLLARGYIALAADGDPGNLILPRLLISGLAIFLPTCLM